MTASWRNPVCEYVINHFLAIRCGEPATTLRLDKQAEFRYACEAHAMPLRSRK